MIRAVIIDDELSGRKILTRLVQRHLEQVEIVGTAASVREGTVLITDEAPDLVFLDIEMKDGNGFDLLQALPQRDFQLIFVTAYSEFALKAFQFYAIGYLLKPVEVAELVRVVEEVIRRNPNRPQSAGQQLELLQNLLFQNQPNKAKLGLPSQNGIQFVVVSEIICCNADESYTEVLLADGSRVIVSKKLIEIEELLKDHNFFRIHRTHLINLHHLKSYLRGNGGQVILTNDIQLDVSRRKKEAFLKRIKTLG